MELFKKIKCGRFLRHNVNLLQLKLGITLHSVHWLQLVSSAASAAD